MAEALIPVRGAIVPVSQASTDDLRKFASRIRILVEEEGVHGGNAHEVSLLASVDAVLAHREEEEFERLSPGGTGESVSVSLSDPKAITKRLESIAVSHHLVTPCASVEFVPEGFGVEFTFIRFDVVRDFWACDDAEEDAWILRAPAMKRIGAAAGVRFTGCRRVDDRKEPYVALCEASAVVDNFDGTPRVITSSASLDYRDGSEQVKRMKARWSNKGDFELALKRARDHIHEKAETAAKMRVIADLGVSRRYTSEERARPFAVARSVFTGQSADPEVRRQFALLRAKERCRASAALYGSPSFGVADEEHLAAASREEVSSLGEVA